MDSSTVDIREDPRDCFFFGIVSRTGNRPKGLLEVKGKFLNIQWKKATEDDLSDTILLHCSTSGEEFIIGKAILDAKEPKLRKGTIVRALAMSRVKHESGTTFSIEGMLVIEADLRRGRNTWRRIGFFRIYRENVFDGVERRRMNII